MKTNKLLFLITFLGMISFLSAEEIKTSTNTVISNSETVKVEEDISKLPLKMTGSTPMCPHCKIATEREIGWLKQTIIYIPSLIDEKGEVKKFVDSQTQFFKCNKCNKIYGVKNGQSYEKN